MIETEKKLVYKAFGLRISSEIPLPELMELSQHVDTIDVEITLAAYKGELEGVPNQYVVLDNQVMFYIPDHAYYCIKEGKTITISIIHDADPDLIRLYLLGTCMGALLIQRGIYPLHGSAIAIHGKAYAIVGDSGAGKSTLASAFLNQGYQLLSDDVIAVSLSSDEHIPFVTPSYPQQKLWEDSLSNFGMETSHYRSIFLRENKYCVPVSTKFFTDCLPLAGVFELIKTEDTEIGIRRIEKLERIHTLFCHTYRNNFIPDLGLMDWHFNTSASIVKQIDMFQIRRPMSGFSAPQLVSTILETLNKGE